MYKFKQIKEVWNTLCIKPGTHGLQRPPKDEPVKKYKHKEIKKKKQHQCIQYSVNQFSSALINLSCKTQD